MSMTPEERTRRLRVMAQATELQSAEPEFLGEPVRLGPTIATPRTFYSFGEERNYAPKWAPVRPGADHSHLKSAGSPT
jgi:hypothetical protein